MSSILQYSFESPRLEEYKLVIKQGRLFDSENYKSKIPVLFYKSLIESGMVDKELLTEALLHRGFLAYKDAEGVWLGTGSHPDDLTVLGWVFGLSVVEVKNHKDRMARVNLTLPVSSQPRVVESILAIPQNHGFMGPPAYKHSYKGSEWNSYRNTVWGTKLSVCPSTHLGEFRLGYDALDAGIALLVKAWPLARVSTAFCGSCDGHGESLCRISFATKWDELWAKAVFTAINMPTHGSIWFEQRASEIKTITGSDNDESVLAMMKDIQKFARRLMQQDVIIKIGKARKSMLLNLGDKSPSLSDFALEAKRQLAIMDLKTSAC